jgi:hypothetical protein
VGAHDAHRARHVLVLSLELLVAWRLWRGNVVSVLRAPSLRRLFGLPLSPLFLLPLSPRCFSSRLLLGVLALSPRCSSLSSLALAHTLTPRPCACVAAGDCMTRCGDKPLVSTLEATRVLEVSQDGVAR